MLRRASYLVQRYALGRDTVLARLPQFDLELRVPSRDALGRNLFTDGIHAPAVADFLATGMQLQPGELAFDIGAGVGWHSLLLSRVVPRGAEIHAFEPDPWARGLLRENAARNRADGLCVVEAAVGPAPGKARLHRYGSRREQGRWRARRTAAIDVPMVSLDDYCRGAGLAGRPVGFIKLGVQGFELQVLEGARATLARCRLLLTEFAPDDIYRSGVHPAQLLDLLVELGFIPELLTTAGAVAVTRAEILASGKPQDIRWRRPGGSARPVPAAPDPRALAI